MDAVRLSYLVHVHACHSPPYRKLSKVHWRLDLVSLLSDRGFGMLGKTVGRL